MKISLVRDWRWSPASVLYIFADLAKYPKFGVYVNHWDEIKKSGSVTQLILKPPFTSVDHIWANYLALVHISQVSEPRDLVCGKNLPSCITHWPPPTYRISSRSDEKMWADGHRVRFYKVISIRRWPKYLIYIYISVPAVGQAYIFSSCLIQSNSCGATRTKCGRGKFLEHFLVHTEVSAPNRWAGVVRFSRAL